MYGHPNALQDMIDFFGEPISIYTRADAIRDGMLVDVSETAQEAGFKVPVALTHAVWSDCVEWSGEDSERQVPQDEGGRLWDVLYMARFAAKAAAKRDTDVIDYVMLRVPRGGRATRARRVVLMLRIHGGDHGEPVATIGFPGED